MNPNLTRCLKAGALVLGGLTIGCLVWSGSFSSPRMARAAVGITPFTLETALYTFTGNPAGELRDQRTEARRSDGSEVFIGSVLGQLGAKAGARARKVTLIDGRSITLDDSIAVKTTWPRRPSDQANRLRGFLSDVPANCVFYPGETLLGYDSVLGQRTAIIKDPFAGGGNRQVTKWRAVGLGCKTLKYRLEAKNTDGSSTLLAEEKPVSLKLGEPAPALFDTGEDYVEVKPSEQWRLQAQHVGIAWNSGKEIEQSKDAIYLGLPSPSHEAP